MNAIVRLLVKHGYSILFASVFARQMCLPVPAILFLIAAGALAGSGRMTLAIALGLAIMACLLADMMWYEAGRRWGDRILHFIYGLALDPDGAARRSKKTFVRHGPRTLMLAKFVVGLDLATPPLAGLSGTSRLRFIAFDTVGALSGQALTPDSAMSSAKTWIMRLRTQPDWARFGWSLYSLH
jgi:membrane protein DedA with SNARE-associated domain